MASSALAGKVALITGGTKGIGRAVATTLVQRGANVAVNYASDASSAKSLVAELGADHVLPIQGDAGKVADIEAMVKATVDKWGKIDILMPNAGLLLMNTLEATTEENFDKSYALNVKGPYFLAQKAVPHMPPGSSIVFVSTSVCAASTVSPPYCLYVSTKGAIEQLTRATAKDLATKGIRVNCVSPGPTATELFFKGKPDQLVETIKGFSPFKKLGEPEQIADAVAFLAGEQSGWVAGQILRVNGAMTVG